MYGCNMTWRLPAWTAGRPLNASGSARARQRKPNGRRHHGCSSPSAACHLETAVPGSFAAGDVRHRSIKRVATAAGEGAMAIAAGAHVLEVHVRHDETSQNNPDYLHSLSIADFRTYCGLARSAALMLGDGIKKTMPSERFNVRHRYLP